VEFVVGKLVNGAFLYPSASPSPAIITPTVLFIYLFIHLFIHSLTYHQRHITLAIDSVVE
jgi:hypothetical protein